MARRSENWFRRVGKATLTLAAGGEALGYGAVLPWREEGAALWGQQPHALGRLPGPLYQFVGSFPELLGAQGARLVQGGQAYRVLRAWEAELAGRPLCQRAVLERWEENG